MRQFQQSESVAARRDLFVQMVSDDDGLTGATGLSLTVEIVKAGGSDYAGIAGSDAEISDGTYKISLAAGDLDTVGGAMLKITATDALPQLVPIQIVTSLDEAHYAKAALVNKREHTVATGVDVIMDDDGETPLITMTPSEIDGVVTLTPS